MIVLCFEASHGRGLGHVLRMLRLGRALRASGGETILVCNDDPAAKALVHAEGFPVWHAPLDQVATGWEAPLLDQLGEVKAWVNDRLRTARAHTETLRARGILVATVDDSGDGADGCDYHVIPLFSGGTRRKGQRILEGWEWAFFPADEILEARTRPHAHRTGEPAIGVSLGGSDTHATIIPVLQRLVGKGREVHVCLGPAFGADRKLGVWAGDPRVQWHREVPSLVRWLSEFDLAVTGGGMTALESAACGTPPCVVANEVHEVATALRLERDGLGTFWGSHSDLPDLPSAAFADLPLKSSRGRALRVDGAERFASILLGRSP